jgi:hypothetical protein
LQTRRGVRNPFGSGWLPEPRGYTLIAACRSNEEAFEKPVRGLGRRGALTHALLQSLEDAGEKTTYRMLYERIFALVRGRLSGQTPVLEGEGDRLVLGAEHVRAPYAVPVMRVDGGRIVLNVGVVEGFEAGATFDLYPPGTRALRPSRRIGTATLAKPGTTDSWAELDGAPSAEIVPGTLAVPRSPGIRLVRRVRILRDGADAAALQALEFAAREIDANGWVEETPAGMSDDWQLAVTAAGEFEVRDADGNPVPNLRPALVAAASGAPGRVVRRLAHLARWHNLRDIENTERMCQINGRVHVERLITRDGKPRWDRVSRVRAAPGDEILLRAVNDSSDQLNVTALLLQPTWAAEQVYPLSRGSFSAALTVGDPAGFTVRVPLPQGETRATAVLKVFAAIGAPNFRVLQLPVIDRPVRPDVMRDGGVLSHPIQAVFDAFAAVRPEKRELVPSPYSGFGWTVVTVPIDVAPPGEE